MGDGGIIVLEEPIVRHLLILYVQYDLKLVGHAAFERINPMIYGVAFFTLLYFKHTHTHTFLVHPSMWQKNITIPPPITSSRSLAIFKLHSRHAVRSLPANSKFAVINLVKVFTPNALSALQCSLFLFKRVQNFKNR